VSYPAYYIVHCATGPVFCCDDHMQKLVGLQRFLGVHAHVETIADAGECGNCVNESRARTHDSGITHERRVVGHVSGWQEQMPTCVCGNPWPCSALSADKS
jgi:hypothetical protein